ncbi:MAG TPA: DUF2157 domain-containing protein [Xanthomonadales bacterium]|nr:DUF2157 domain-containing protein [Xanthomonadales bacterium]
MTGRDEALAEIADIAARHQLSADDIARALQDAQSPQPARRSSGILARVLAYLGGIFVLAGIALFTGMQWNQLNSAARVLVTLGTGFAFYLFALAAMTDPRYARATTPMLLIAALLQPTGIVVMLDEYARGGQPEHGLLFMCVVMFVQQFLTFLAKRRTVLLFFAIFFGAAGFGTLCNILDIDFEFTAFALGIGLSCVAYALDRSVHKAITPFWYFSGAGFFLYGAFDLLNDTAFEIAYFGITAGVMYLATVVRSRTLLLVSVLALTSFTGYFFRDSLASAFGLILMGILLIGLSALAMQLNQKYIQGRR